MTRNEYTRALMEMTEININEAKKELKNGATLVHTLTSLGEQYLVIKEDTNGDFGIPKGYVNVNAMNKYINSIESKGWKIRSEY